jgi:hypothetical protein
LGNILGTSFANSGFSYDANISPNNQSFSGAVLATILRQTAINIGGIIAGTGSFANITIGTATISSEFVGTATITSLSVPGTATINQLQGGTATFADVDVTALLTVSGTATITQLTVAGTATFQGVVAFGPTANGLVSMQPDTGTFTGTFGGLTTTVTGVAYWSRNGNQVSLLIPYGTGSKAAAGIFSFAPIPAEIQPVKAQYRNLVNVISGGTFVVGGGQVGLTNNATATLFQGAGGNGFAGASAIGYAATFECVTYAIGP